MGDRGWLSDEQWSASLIQDWLGPCVPQAEGSGHTQGSVLPLGTGCRQDKGLIWIGGFQNIPFWRRFAETSVRKGGELWMLKEEAFEKCVLVQLPTGVLVGNHCSWQMEAAVSLTTASGQLGAHPLDGMRGSPFFGGQSAAQPCVRGALFLLTVLGRPAQGLLHWSNQCKPQAYLQ